MKKMNKKGFTLIEMLVVIAIIAVLVSIIIPTVSSATVKAEAASNAANMRSLKAEIVTAILSGDTTSNAHWTITMDTTDKNKVDSVAVKTGFTLPFDSTDVFEIVPTTDGSSVTVWLNGFDIDDYAAVAENGGDLALTGQNTTRPEGVTAPSTGG